MMNMQPVLRESLWNGEAGGTTLGAGLSGREKSDKEDVSQGEGLNRNLMD